MPVSADWLRRMALILIIGCRHLTLGGAADIELGGNVTTLNGNLTFEDKVIADGSGDQRFDAGTV